MADFFKRHAYLVIWISSLIIIGALATIILQLNGYIPTPLSPAAQPSGQTTPGIGQVAQPTIPAPPQVTLTIIKSTGGNSLFIQWQNLPDGATVLDIYRGKTGTDPSTWTLWKTVSLAEYNLENGSAQIELGSATEAGYSFSVDVVGQAPENGPGDEPPILWTSSSTVPTVTTSTPPEEPGDNPQNPPPSNNPSSSNPTPPPQSPPSSPSSSNPVSSGSPSSTPSGIPYYNPQVQISEYGNEPGNFWVEHVNQSIEIGWQNLPADVSSVIVARSQSSDGPWNTILNQQDPGTSGSYSLQIIDDTVHDPYYYEMTAFNGTTTVATYGPEFLAGQ